MTVEAAEPRFHPLPATADARGWSVGIPDEVLGLLARVADIHLATIEPGAVRGNHAHALKTELIVVSASDAWEFWWDRGAGTPRAHRRFALPGAVAVLVAPNAAHAVENVGAHPLTMSVISDHPYDVGNPDSIARELCGDGVPDVLPHQ